MMLTHEPSLADPSIKRDADVPRVHGRLRLRFEAVRSAKLTVLKECEQQPPLKVVRAFPLNDGGALVHLNNLSGGVLGGDLLELAVEIGPAAVVQLTSTGATRLYRSRRGAPAARQSARILVGENGLLEYLPDPLIPFSGSRYCQETVVELSAGAGLFWWETVAPGREARGELFAYELLHLKTDISASGRPIALERIRLEPSERPPSSPVRLGPYRYFSSFYICRAGVESSRWLELEARLGELARHLSSPARVLWGVSTLPAEGLIVRALSVKGWDIRTGLSAFWRSAKLYLYGSDATPPRKIY
jgi:urease accessory protein